MCVRALERRRLSRVPFHTNQPAAWLIDAALTAEGLLSLLALSVEMKSSYFSAMLGLWSGLALYALVYPILTGRPSTSIPRFPYI